MFFTVPLAVDLGTSLVVLSVVRICLRELNICSEELCSYCCNTIVYVDLALFRALCFIVKICILSAGIINCFNFPRLSSSFLSYVLLLCHDLFGNLCICFCSCRCYCPVGHCSFTVFVRVRLLLQQTFWFVRPLAVVVWTLSGRARRGGPAGSTILLIKPVIIWSFLRDLGVVSNYLH